MTAPTGRRHPANRGLVMLAVWVRPSLREAGRLAAEKSGCGVSEVVTRACVAFGCGETAKEVGCITCVDVRQSASHITCAGCIDDPIHPNWRRAP